MALYNVISKTLAMESFNRDGLLLWTVRSDGLLCCMCKCKFLFYSVKLFT